MSVATIYKPGQICPISGQYALVNQFGQRFTRQSTVVKGEPFPPTPVGGYGWVLADATRH